MAATTEEFFWLVEWMLHFPSFSLQIKLYNLISACSLFIQTTEAHWTEEEVALFFVYALTEGENSFNVVLIFYLVFGDYLEVCLSNAR